MKKKFIVLALLCISGLSLGACSSQKASEADSGTAAESTMQETSAPQVEETKDTEPAGADMEKGENMAVYSESEVFFRQEIYTDGTDEATLPYNIFVPENYDSTKKYPLVVFLADSSIHSDNPEDVLYQDGALVWASPEEQEVRECIVLAPQYTEELKSSLGGLIAEDGKSTKGIELISSLIHSISEEYSVDTNKIYGTGQGDGAVAIAALQQKSNIFAAEYLVAPKKTNFDMNILKNDKLWILVTEGDADSYTYTNEIVSDWKNAGINVGSGGLWNSEDSLAFDMLAEETLNQGADINYTVFAGGDFNSVSSIGYTVDAIRAWLFTQSK